MSEVMKLKDGTKISLIGGAFIDDLTTIADSEEAAITICEKITSNNISDVKFYHEDEIKPYKTYEYLALLSQPTRQNEVDENEETTGRVIVKVHLRTQSELEIRVSKIEEKLKNL